ncbi:MAG: TIGR03960 family B12-binding radical SAM protein [Candidatus Omnitrophota bacterium]
MTINELNELNDFISKLENPQIYTGQEINAVRKNLENRDDFIHVCLVFPDKYEIGMSHYGLVVLYHWLNRMPGVNAERCFLPDRGSIETFKAHGMKLFSLENKVPLDQFDIIAFSIMSEMNYTNIFQVLELAGIPFRSAERSLAHPFPLVMAGGISTVNPEPLREFVDAFGIGDGEALFPDIIAAVSDVKEKRKTRQALLEALDRIEGVYVPALYPLVKRGRFYTPDMAPGKIKRRVLASLDGTFPDDRLITPITNIVFNRLNVEIARGCPQRCRFCQAKSYYAPYRPRPLEENIRHIKEGLRKTGFETFSLSTLSAGDYPQLNELLELIPDILALGPGVNFSLSSMRPSTLSHHLLSTIALYKRTGITIVPEAGTQRLRNVINKNVTDEEIFQAVELALKNRWQKIKLYFMLGLPTETMADIEGIVRLMRQMMDMSRSARQKIRINASFSPFVPKPQTPLQWASGENRDHIYESIRYLKHEMHPFLKSEIMEFDFHVPNNAVIETLIARGDVRVGELLLKAYERGEIFSAWGTDFHYSVWADLLSPEDDIFLKELAVDEPLPWDFLQVNYYSDHLKQEYQKALQAEATPSCDQTDCGTCGGCRSKQKRSGSGADAPILEELTQEIRSMKAAIPDPMPFRKVRLVYEKTGSFTFFSHLAMMQYIERLIRGTGIFFRCTEGFTPRIKMQSLPPLPVFAAGLEEIVELYMEASLSDAEILDRLNAGAEPQGFRFQAVIGCPDDKKLSRDVHFLGYEIVVDDPEAFRDRIAEHLAETDSVAYGPDRITLRIDYLTQGQERFARIYKLIDPDKQRTMNLTRTHVEFKGSA